MKKTIWFISKYSKIPQNGGVGSRDFMILKELAKMGCHCFFITSFGNHLSGFSHQKKIYEIQDVNDVHVCKIKTNRYKRAKSVGRIISWIVFELRLFLLPNKYRHPKPDVVVASSLSLLSIFNGLVLKNRYKCRLIFEIRDIWPLTLTEEGGYSNKNLFILLLGWIEKIGYKRADVIVGTMPNLGEHVKNILGYEKKTFCIPMGVDVSQITPSQSISPDYQEKYILRDKKIIGYAGTIGITNALDIFFECARLMKDDESIYFLVIGSGDLKEAYVEKTKDLDNVGFAPKVLKEQVPSVLAQCSILFLSTFPSKVWEYGQSLNKVIDYMLAGKPIICSYSGYQSMINEANCGIFTTPGDVVELKNAVLAYADLSQSERDSIGERGRKWIIENRQFSILARNYYSIMFPEL